LGVKRENLIMCDTKGVIYVGRGEGMNKYKDFFATKDKARTLTEAMVGADVFVGVSVAGAVTPEMLKGMAKKPIVFAMANPDPEIDPKIGDEVSRIFATGRSDFPNQINNALSFPGIFRGALDVQASEINEAMKLAAAQAIAECVPGDALSEDYIIPSVFDRDVVPRVAKAVAAAARATGTCSKCQRQLTRAIKRARNMALVPTSPI
jgi:malic enzyme